MKTSKEIVKKIREDSDADLFGTTSDLLVYLPFEEAKEFLKPKVTEKEWKKTQKVLTKENVIAEMEEYMPFALDKASSHRGLSANRSIQHFENWLFLLDDSETLGFLQDEDNYENYGCPMLKKICDKYGFKYPEESGMQNMARGVPCYPNCQQGCGR